MIQSKINPQYAKRIRQKAYSLVHRYKGEMANKLTNREILEEAVKLTKAGPQTEDSRISLSEFTAVLTHLH